MALFLAPSLSDRVPGWIFSSEKVDKNHRVIQSKSFINLSKLTQLYLYYHFKVFDNLVVIVKFVLKSQLIFPFRPFVLQKNPEQFLSKRMPEMIKNSLRVSYLHCIYDTTVVMAKEQSGLVRNFKSRNWLTFRAHGISVEVVLCDLFEGHEVFLGCHDGVFLFLRRLLTDAERNLSIHVA